MATTDKFILNSDLNGVLNPVLSVNVQPESYITFITNQSELLKITEEGFFVRGKKVEADEQEAASVYRAFKEFLIWSALTRE